MWWVYVVRCADDTLYCGIAKNVAARMAQHEAGKGAKYTRGRGPLTLLLERRCRAQGTALRLEHAIKQLTRAEKQQLDARLVDRIAKRLGRTRTRALARR